MSARLYEFRPKHPLGLPVEQHFTSGERTNSEQSRFEQFVMDRWPTQLRETERTLLGLVCCCQGLMLQLVRRGSSGIIGPHTIPADYVPLTVDWLLHQTRPENMVFVSTHAAKRAESVTPQRYLRRELDYWDSVEVHGAGRLLVHPSIHHGKTVIDEWRAKRKAGSESIPFLEEVVTTAEASGHLAQPRKSTTPRFAFSYPAVLGTRHREDILNLGTIELHPEVGLIARPLSNPEAISLLVEESPTLIRSCTASTWNVHELAPDWTQGEPIPH